MFGPGFGHDVINDFQHNEDHIDLRGFNFGSFSSLSIFDVGGTAIVYFADPDPSNPTHSWTIELTNISANALTRRHAARTHVYVWLRGVLYQVTVAAVLVNDSTNSRVANGLVRNSMHQE